MDIGMRSLHPAAADHSVSIRGSRCTALIILSLRSRAVVFTTALPVREWETERASAGVTARQRWSRSHGRRETVPVKTVTLGVCGGQPPACFSTKRADFSKRVHGWSRLFKDVLSPVRFWVRSISGASGRSRSLPHVSGHSARWGSFRGWFMFFMWGHDHLGVAQ